VNIAFYAPMKPPSHPVPSGDRRVARLLMQALRRAGHRVDLASRFRAWEGAGDADWQRTLRHRGEDLAGRYLRRLRTRPAEMRPDLWFTYHLYHKAPDWIGPRVAREHGIPYVVAEASFAPKQDGGPWHEGHHAVAAALARADLVLSLSRLDSVCVRPLLAAPERLMHLRPFLDPAPFARAARRRQAHRQALAARWTLDPDVPWLICIAMMREGDKLASYQLLGAALERLNDLPFSLLVAGDGPARDQVLAACHGIERRVRWLGQVRPAGLPPLYAAADAYVWPAINEAYGMAFLEAQAAGLPVVAGAAGGVPEVVADGDSGLLTAEGDAGAFAAAVRRMLTAPDLRARMGRAAARRVIEEHGLDAAAAMLDEAVQGLGSGSGR